MAIAILFFVVKNAQVYRLFCSKRHILIKVDKIGGLVLLFLLNLRLLFCKIFITKASLVKESVTKVTERFVKTTKSKKQKPL